ncbi:uncharacterized protein PgNI_04248 [Pyricularia grisea]|uniref:Uncharacterized protein n=1 Tax=Pyricularia grisea TaxID=148305 RepID=A0A6P8B885_PYRGI|nr:uncharacterized protein PgNI_04248 [Pyricularia grisea]TLD12084.1 hypothetical protein PgNI_04248 [Pyricularia grisea]
MNDKLPVRTAQDLGMMSGSLMSPAGGIRSPVRDLLTWGCTLLGPFRNEGGLSRAAARAPLVFYHTGAISGYHGCLMLIC